MCKLFTLVEQGNVMIVVTIQKVDENTTNYTELCRKNSYEFLRIVLLFVTVQNQRDYSAQVLIILQN